MFKLHLKNFPAGVKKLFSLPSRTPLFLGLFLLLFGFTLGAASFFYLQKKAPAGLIKETAYEKFITEVYDKIKENYWNKVTDEELSELFRLAAEKITPGPKVLLKNDKQGVKIMVNQTVKKMAEKQKKEFVLQLANIVLANLTPFGRSGLYGQEQEEELKNMVQNINPQKNLYEVLGIDKNASDMEVRSAFEKKLVQLEPQKEKLPETEKKIEELKDAYEVLSNPLARQNYDETGAEPTVSFSQIQPGIVYLRFVRLSPTTFDEFRKAADSIKPAAAAMSLIIDLRVNIGGSADILPYLLGPFIGQNQYAFEFFHQGQYLPFKTKTGWLASLVPYKKVVILVDDKTQSSAELMASVLKKYNVGILVGKPTKGWGTIERAFPLSRQIDEQEKYSIFLAHSLALRDDNQPIEGRGVDPLINIGDPGWEEQLFGYFNDSELIQAVKEIIES